jgi:hypothetical protein
MKPTKRIHIPYNGPIYAKQGVYGPIVTPYKEDLDVIQQMLVAGIPVYEVVDGREIKLTLSNFKQDFTKQEQEEKVTVDKNPKIPVPSDFTKVEDTEVDKKPEESEENNKVEGNEPSSEENKQQEKNNSNKNNANARNQEKKDIKPDKVTKK